MQIKLNYLKAANAAASTEQTRYYLKGVSLTMVGADVLFVATDGHVLIALRHELDTETERSWPGNGAIVPSALISQIKQTPASKRCGDVAEISFKDGVVTIAVVGGATYAMAAIDGAFPDWRRVIPQTVSGELAQFDPALLGVFVKARKALSNGQSKFVTIGHNGHGPALVQFCDSEDDGFGVLMPIRGEAPTRVPSWVNGCGQSMAQAAE
jgi:DNA polymerase-3 subunit beta